MSYAARASLPAEATGTIAEAAGGIAIIVLSIIGLARIDAAPLNSIAVTVLGAALLTNGGAVVTEYAQLTGDFARSGAPANGVMSEVVAGAAILVLGILCLLGVSPEVLAPISVIAAGAMLLISAPMTTQFAEVRWQGTEMQESTRLLMRSAATSSCGLQMLAGLGAVVLGILALVAGGPTGTGGYAQLTAVALLVLGAALVLSTSMMSGTMLRFFSRR
ncbi:MAG: hypothetical protein KGJ78_01880 [Alphaproteobacteria bacterium]|nr:hypothetical protein [Alphaproteobacteria bacterium]